MTAPETPGLAGMSIGAVLDLLRPDFPDVTISKIRFLEAEGLVTPQRAASGYRRFTAYDCARLRFILTAQRDQYLPLKVIKAQLDAQPDGELPLAGSPYGVPRLVSVDNGESDQAGSDPAAVAPTRIRLSREDLLERSGVDAELMIALIKAGVITTACSSKKPPGPVVITPALISAINSSASTPERSSRSSRLSRMRVGATAAGSEPA